MLSLAALPLPRADCYSIYLFWALAVLPIGLIEQRYYLSGIMLLQLLRLPQPEKVEAAHAAYWAVLAIFFLVGISEGRFFL